ncbi:MAG: hypothetical protein EOO77_41040 [Oxalobacteraceae bacterium]|nr:MAG: hypothetical protein EOO77_41040 [Oxalobacteraceae bacterium]
MILNEFFRPDTRAVKTGIPLNELFDRTANVTWAAPTKTLCRGRFEIGAVPYDISAASQDGKNWTFSFFIASSYAAQNGISDAWGKTGTGNGMDVMGTACQALIEFVSQRRPTSVSFTGANYHGKGRLYIKLVTRMLGKIEPLGYTVTHEDQGAEVEFTVRRTKMKRPHMLSPSTAESRPPTR